MTQTEFERALEKALKSLFDDANYGLEQVRKLDPTSPPNEELDVVFANACESMIAILAKLETLRAFADAMANPDE